MGAVGVGTMDVVRVGQSMVALKMAETTRSSFKRSYLQLANIRIRVIGSIPRISFSLKAINGFGQFDSAQYKYVSGTCTASTVYHICLRQKLQLRSSSYNSRKNVAIKNFLPSCLRHHLSSGKTIQAETLPEQTTHVVQFV